MSFRQTALGRRPALLLGLSASLALPSLALPSIARAAPLSVTDALGRTVALKALPERIVLGFNFEEFTAVASPAGWDRVVGFSRTLWADWRPGSFKRYGKPIPRLASLPDVGSTDDGSFSLEKLLALRPDLVVLPEWSFSVLAEPVRRLEALGIPVLVIDYNAEIPERHAASTVALGQVTGNEARGRELAALYLDRIADIRRRVATPERQPSAYLELGQGGAGTVGNTYWQSMWGRLLDLVNARNIAAGRIPAAWGPLSPEYVLKADPDVIFIAGSSWVNRPNAVLTGFDATEALTRQRLAPYAQREGWPALKAVRTGELHAIEHGLCRCLPDFTAALYLAKQLHPDRFADIDPVAELRRFHEQWLPVPLEGCWMTRLTPGAT